MLWSERLCVNQGSHLVSSISNYMCSVPFFITVKLPFFITVKLPFLITVKLPFFMIVMYIKFVVDIGGRY